MPLLSRASAVVNVTNAASTSPRIPIGGYRRFILFFAATFSTNPVSVYVLHPSFDADRDNASAFVDSGIDVTPSAGGVVVLDSDLIGHEEIKLVANVADNGKAVGYRGA